MITGIYAAVAAIILVYLSTRVIGLRRGKKISVGPAGDADMERAMRVQANFVEYTPLALILLAISELNGLPALGVHALGASFILARLIHFLGFRSSEAPGLFRVLGMALTFLLLLVLAAIVGVQALPSLTSDLLN